MQSSDVVCPACKSVSQIAWHERIPRLVQVVAIGIVGWQWRYLTSDIIIAAKEPHAKMIVLGVLIVIAAYQSEILIDDSIRLWKLLRMTRL